MPPRLEGVSEQQTVNQVLGFSRNPNWKRPNHGCAGEMRCLAVGSGPVPTGHAARSRPDFAGSRSRNVSRSAVRVAASAGASTRRVFHHPPRVLCLYPPIADAYPCHVFRARISHPAADDTKNGAVRNGASVVPPYTSSPASPAGGEVPDDAVAKSDSESNSVKKKFVTGRPDEQFSWEAAQERQALFNDIAPVYDTLNDVLSLGLHRVWKRAAVRWTGVGPGDKGKGLSQSPHSASLIAHTRR